VARARDTSQAERLYAKIIPIVHRPEIDPAEVIKHHSDES
jgi:hypothetical protein